MRFPILYNVSPGLVLKRGTGANVDAIHELLDPGFVHFQDIFEKEFAGLTRIDVKYSELVETRKKLISMIKSDLTDDEKQFLISIKTRKPDWDLLGVMGIDDLPAVRWKLINLSKMPVKKHLLALNKLEKILGL